MSNITVKLTLAEIGELLSNSLVISCNVGTPSIESATKTQLLQGIDIVVDDTATTVTVTSTGSCTSSYTMQIQGRPIPTTTTTSTTTLAPIIVPNIGDDFLGGILIYILQESDTGYDADFTKGIIISPTDLSTSCPWSLGTWPFPSVTTSQALGSGVTNTSAIIAVQGEGVYAAKLCNDLVIEEYNDWYLPSLTELAKIYANKGIIEFGAVSYHSSSQASTSNVAWVMFFNYPGYNGTTQQDLKSFNHGVRAIRYFEVAN